MSKFVLAYNSGGAPPPVTPAEQDRVMAEWTAWFGTLGSDLIDPGNPFGAGKSVAADGSVTEATGKLSGYSIVNAASLDAATGTAKGCPVLADGGSVDVYEAIDM
ncbi:MAG: hypothetical protein JWR88_2081 [Pseudonocardia sp.]|jgi:hypothetical protein|nr:hypothetical protein [Pseudonocardia sp.]